MVSIRTIFTLAVTLLAYLRNVHCFPVIPSKIVVLTNDQISFMQKYGYLEDDHAGYGAQYSKNTIAEAIKNVQRFGGLPQTGSFNDDTIKLMKKRKCGVKDIIRESTRRRRYTVVGRGWKKSIITYNVQSWSATLGEQLVRNDIKRALDMWAQHGGITFVPTDDPKADIKVSFHALEHGDALSINQHLPYPFDGPGGILGHAFFPYINSGGSVHFDSDESWGPETDETGETTGFFLAAVHELGHALGLGHSDVPTAIMYPYYTENDARDLDRDDILALNKLYRQYSSNITITTNTTLSGTKFETTHLDEHTTELLTSVTNITNETFDYSATHPITSSTESIYHKEEELKSTQPTSPIVVFEDICNGFDTIATISGDIFVFKGRYVWRFKKRNKPELGYPTSIQTIFPKFPLTIDRVDCVYERRDGSIAFFSGSEHWIYREDGIEGPFHMNNYKIFDNISIDAIMLWPLNKKTYIFKGDLFWRYDEETNSMDEGYPKNMTRWKGIPNDVDVAINWDGETYFFKDLLCWKFDNILIKADRHYPLPGPQIWFGCPETQEIFQLLPKEILTRGYL